jgi:hypothetical protein
VINPLESVRVGKNLVERLALNGDHNFLQKIHEHQFDAPDLSDSEIRGRDLYINNRQNI